MMFWVREVVGWLLVGVGLLSFLGVYIFCERRWIFEAAILMLFGIVVFRGGIHLLKVAVAANAARQAQQAATHTAASGRGGRFPIGPRAS